MSQQATVRRQTSGRGAQLGINALLTFDLSDRRILTFWLLELYGTLLFCLAVAMYSHLIIIRDSANTSFTSSSLIAFARRYFIDLPLGSRDLSMPLPTQTPYSNTSLTSGDSIVNDQDSVSGVSSYAKLVSIDVWFAISLMATVDAVAVVFNFNRMLTGRFHYAVSLRMMMTASIMSFGLLMWNMEGMGFVSSRPVASALVGIGCFILGGRIMDRYEPPMPTTATRADIIAGYARGNLQQYSEVISLYDVNWPRAILAAGSISTVGFVLTMIAPPQWSTVTPIILSITENVVLTALRTTRTPRYTILSFPFVQAMFCVNWGVIPLRTAPQLAIPPWAFVVLFVAGRLLLDLQMSTVFRSRPELQWIRSQVLPSTPKILVFCAAAYGLEMMGIRVIKYAKPVSLSLSFLLTSAVYPMPYVYSIAFGKIKTIRK